MKFLKKVNRNYIILLAITLLLMSVGGYFILLHIISNETKESLLEKEELIKKQITETGEVPNLYPIIEVKEIGSYTPENALFKEIYIKNEQEDELECYIEYSNQVRIKESFYSIKIRQATFESEDLILILSLSLFILLISGLGVSFFISKKMNKTVWTDFEHNLKKIEKFSLNDHKSLNLLKSDIEEFDRLNKVVNTLTKKLKSDYYTLKELTENASHEIQTPLSIVLLNLDEVLQQELSPEMFKKVINSINALKRLSTLNQSLILLAKIENRQFIADKVLIINEVVKRKMEEFTSLFESKKIKAELHIEQDFSIKMNEQLADILINNLLSNAVKHNIARGNIFISIKEKELKICNSGEPNTLTNETIFNRFAKENSKSYGLGLAIVKNICDTHQLDIQYVKDEVHCFIIHQKL